MTTLVQNSLAKGEVTPELYGRIDQSLYSIALRTCRNAIPMRFGSAQNRPGSQFVAQTRTTGKTVRLIPFTFNQSQSYVLEFGNLYVRFYKDGTQITESAKTITNVTSANPGVVTSALHGFSNGDEVALAAIEGMVELNGRNAKVAGVTANTFQLTDLDGNNINTSLLTAYSSGGTASRVYTVTTTYIEADLQEINYAQSADVLTLVHPNYAPKDLTRASDTSWTFASTAFAPLASGVSGVSATAGGAGSNSLRYRISAIDATTLEESFSDILDFTTPKFEAVRAITNITQANPAVVTSNAHGYSNGDEVSIYGVTGMIQVNNLRFIAAGVAANTFQLKGIDSSAYTAYAAGGTASRTYARVDAAADPTAAAPVVLAWTGVGGQKEFRVYKEVGGTYGLLAIVAGVSSAGGTSLSFSTNDIGAPPDLTVTAPLTNTPLFAAAGDYPSVVAYYQQRRIFANTDNAVATVWCSRTGYFTSFSTHFPLVAGDAINFTLDSTEVNEIRGMTNIGKLILFTAAGEWVVHGTAAGALSANESPNVREASYNGSGTLRPLIVNANALYVQAQTSMVRDLIFEFQQDNYAGKECSIWASHLIEGFSITDWAYQKVPQSIVWAVRDDGVLLSLTYIREQEILAWARHDTFASVIDGDPVALTQGSYENVVAVPEGSETAIYLVALRGTVRFVERLSSRRVNSTNIKDANFTDCGLQYDGRHSDGVVNLRLQGGTTWAYDESITLHSDTAATFRSTDVGQEYHLTGTLSANDTTATLRCRVIGYTSGTDVTVVPHTTVPTGMRTVYIPTWAKAVNKVYGLWHLVGNALSVFGDAYVEGSPLDPQYEIKTVASNGSLTLENHYGVIWAGLPMVSDVGTLDLETTQTESLMGKRMIVTSTTVYLKDSRTLWAGLGTPPADLNGSTDTSQSGLEKMKYRDQETYEETNALVTDKVTIPIEGAYNNNGRVLVRCIDPTPFTILRIAAHGNFPLRQLGS